MNKLVCAHCNKKYYKYKKGAVLIHSTGDPEAGAFGLCIAVGKPKEGYLPYNILQLSGDGRVDFCSVQCMVKYITK